MFPTGTERLLDDRFIGWRTCDHAVGTWRYNAWCFLTWPLGPRICKTLPRTKIMIIYSTTLGKNAEIVFDFSNKILAILPIEPHGWGMLDVNKWLNDSDMTLSCFATRMTELGFHLSYHTLHDMILYYLYFQIRLSHLYAADDVSVPFPGENSCY